MEAETLSFLFTAISWYLAHKTSSVVFVKWEGICSMTDDILSISGRWPLPFEREVLLSFYKLNEKIALCKSQSDQGQLSSLGPGPALPALLSYPQHPAQVEMSHLAGESWEPGRQTTSHCGELSVPGREQVYLVING